MTALDRLRQQVQREYQAEINQPPKVKVRISKPVVVKYRNLNELFPKSKDSANICYHIIRKSLCQQLKTIS